MRDRPTSQGGMRQLHQCPFGNPQVGCRLTRRKQFDMFPIHLPLLLTCWLLFPLEYLLVVFDHPLGSTPFYGFSPPVGFSIFLSGLIPAATSNTDPDQEQYPREDLTCVTTQRLLPPCWWSIGDPLLSPSDRDPGTTVGSTQRSSRYQRAANSGSSVPSPGSTLPR